MNRGFIAIFAFILIALITWIVLLTTVGVQDCPERLPDSYLLCFINEDCYFHPKYNCINYDPLNCIIREDLGARQAASDLIECLCISNQCFTRVKTNATSPGSAPEQPPINITVKPGSNITDIFAEAFNRTS